MADGNEGGAAAAATTTAATTTAAATAAAATTEGAAPAWYAGADELTTGYIQNKGWKSPVEAVQSYQNLEKVLGADRAGRTVVLPGENAQAAEIEAFYTKLGRPAEAKAYKIDVPQGVAPDFAETAKGWFFEQGLTAKQAEGISAKWTEHIGKMTAEQQTAQAEALRADEAKLRAEWGAAFDQNRALAGQVQQKVGISGEEVDKIASVIGLKRTIEMLHNIGKRTGEADFITGSGRATDPNAAMTPAQAKAKIKELTGDREFVKRYTSGDTKAMAEMKRLSEFAAAAA